MLNDESINNTALKKNLNVAAESLNNTVQEVFRISGELRPEALDKMGLDAAVKVLADRIQRENSIAISYRHAGSEARIRTELETSLYRIVQESLKNIVQHSAATKVTLRIVVV